MAAHEEGGVMLTQGALTGVKVLDISRLLPGPYCSMILADHGAEVTAVEDRRFKADNLFFNSVNRNKRHMSLDLKSKDGKRIFFRLAKQADIILEGFRPGVVKRLGVDYEAVKEVNKDIIYCSITGYGQDGPMRDVAGHDVNYLSSAGILDLIGTQDGPPIIPGVQFADIAGGSMNAVIGILLALYARGQTGKGQYIDISMTDGMLGFLTVPHFFQMLTGKGDTRSNSLLSHRYGCYNTYETADKKYLSIGAVENRFWKNLCQHLELPEYISLQYNDNRRLEIIERLRSIFVTKSLSDWDYELANLEVCFSKIQNINEILEDPLFTTRQMVTEMEQKNGKSEKVLGIPVKLSETPGSLRTPPDNFGEGTREVLAESGFTEEEIEGFFRDKVV